MPHFITFAGNNFGHGTTVSGETERHVGFARGAQALPARMTNSPQRDDSPFRSAKL